MANIFPYESTVTQTMREHLLQQKGLVIWLTGYSGSGKSTLANALEMALYQQDHKTFLLDGDNIRTGLNKDLAFSETDRKENLRRIGEVAALMADAGLIVITAFISPYQEDRRKVREIIGADRFIEVFVDCPLEVCESRDVKGLYKKARRGEIKDFTGIQSPYEKPENADITVNTATESLEGCIAILQNQLLNKISLR